MWHRHRDDQTNSDMLRARITTVLHVLPPRALAGGAMTTSPVSNAAEHGPRVDRCASTSIEQDLRLCHVRHVQQTALPRTRTPQLNIKDVDRRLITTNVSRTNATALLKGVERQSAAFNALRTFMFMRLSSSLTCQLRPDGVSVMHMPLCTSLQ